LARLFQLLALVTLGALLATLAGVRDLENAGWYDVTTASLLAIGLYASTYEISLLEARRNLKVILAAVTVGVLAKAVLIGGLMVLLFRDPRFWVLGIAVAQIDPLSVSALMRDSRMSQRAKTILAAWSSFDDPMTVLLVLYVPALIGQPKLPSATLISGLGNWDYPVSLAINVGFALAVGGLWWLARRKLASSLVVAIVGYLLAVLSFAVAVGFLLMLELALAGLLVRPQRLDRLLSWIARFAFAAATLILGVLLTDGIDLVRGAALGTATFVAQLIVGSALTRRLPRMDRLHLVCAQQNGITAIILALLLEQVYPGTVGVIAPAIITTNVLYVLANRAVDRHLAPLIRR
jgi:NhaP-type Na+/H+ or K+/H+ antiporter